MTKWYVVVDKNCYNPNSPTAAVWTVSRDPNELGWETDSGCNGYGLIKADAEELASAANRIEALEKALVEAKDDATRFGRLMEKCVIALREIAWSNDSQWQADRARAALGEKKDG